MFKRALTISLVATMFASSAVFATSAFDKFKSEVKASTKSLVKTTVNEQTSKVDAKIASKVNALNKKIEAKEQQIDTVRANSSLSLKQKYNKIKQLKADIKQLKSDLKAVEETAKK